MTYKDLPVKTGCGTCNDCKYHSMDGHKHQCQNPEKPQTWHEFINETFARGYHTCCILYDESESAVKNDRYASDDWGEDTGDIDD